jgi:outer membrane biosynthesis protein TonB
MFLVPLPPAMAVQLQHCHQSEKDEKATVRVTVEPDGTVSDVSVDSKNEDLRECVERTARRWTFARSRKVRTLTWPLLFASE